MINIWSVNAVCSVRLILYNPSCKCTRRTPLYCLFWQCQIILLTTEELSII